MVKLTIKNMVCRHCVESVQRVLASELQLPLLSVDLGSAVIDGDLTETVLADISRALEKEGFELIHDREAEMVEEVKRRLIELSRKDGEQRESLQVVLMSGFRLSYPSLSRIFSSVEGRSIENYYLNLRIERVKELIKYGQMSLSEIAFRLGYSSVAHLSRQFKQLTGLTPTQFREIGQRKSLPDV